LDLQQITQERLDYPEIDLEIDQPPKNKIKQRVDVSELLDERERED